MTLRMTGYEPVNLAFKVFEPRTGTDSTLSPIIFMHGLTQSKESWSNIAQRIVDATKRKAFVYDARNHGESGYSEKYNFDLNVDDLFHFLKLQNIPRAVLVGHSMGGYTASYAALKKPESVEKIFVEDMFVKKLPQELINPGLPLHVMRKESIQHIPKGLTEQEASNFSNDFIVNQLPKDSPMNKWLDEIRKTKVNLKKNTDGEWVSNYNSDAVIKALKNADTLLSEPNGQYNGPAYFIYGQKSPLNVHNEEEAIRKHFPNAEFIEIAGASHMIHDDFPEEFITNVLRNL